MKIETRDSIGVLFAEALTKGPSGAPGLLSTVVESLPAPDVTRRIEVGQVWCVEARSGVLDSMLLVLTHSSGPFLRGVVTHGCQELATTDDVVVDADQSPTSQSLVLCTWGDVPVHEASLTFLVGEVPRPALKAALMLLQARLSGGFTLRAVGAESTKSLLRWTIAPVCAPEQVQTFVTGTRVIRPEDARLLVRKKLLEHSEWIAAQAFARVLPAELERSTAEVRRRHEG
jgi:hypothetical protein